MRQCAFLPLNYFARSKSKTQFAELCNVYIFVTWLPIFPKCYALNITGFIDFNLISQQLTSFKIVMSFKSLMLVTVCEVQDGNIAFQCIKNLTHFETLAE